MSRFVLNTDRNRPNVLANLVAFLGRLPESKAWEVEVKEYRKTRSTEQNRYYWGVCVDTLSRETGYSKEDVHEYLCGTHFGWQTVTKLSGKAEEIPCRTTTRGYDGKPSTLSRAEFADFVDTIKILAAERGIYIPDPEPMP